MRDDSPRTGSLQSRGLVDRRSVLQVAAGTGVGFGLGTLVGVEVANDDDDGDDGQRSSFDVTETTTARSTTSRDDDRPTTVTIHADSRFAEIGDEVVDELHGAGLGGDVEVEFLEGPHTTITRQNRYQQLLEAEQPEPTIMMMDSGWAMPFLRNFPFPNLSERFSAPVASRVENEYVEPLVETASDRDGALYGLPVFVQAPTIQYRKDLLETAGYDPEGANWATDPPDWELFSQVTKDTMEQTDTQGYTFQANRYIGLSCCTFNEVMSSLGGAYFGSPEKYLFGPVGERPVTVEEDPVLDALRLLRSFIHGTDAPDTLDRVAGDIAPAEVLEYTEEPSRNPFTEGRVVMHKNWPYAIEINAREEQFGSDLGVMPLPTGVPRSRTDYPETGGSVAALGGWHFLVNPYAPSDLQKQAVSVLEAVTTDRVRRFLFEKLALLPPETGLFSSLPADANPLGPYLPQLAYAVENTIPRPVTEVWPQESQRVVERVHAALSGDSTPGAAMTALADDLQTVEAAD
ncbi:extracellular solute-binding protein [Haloarchaeobius sp. HME9146]|uniref:extracellular solute-binding protein n=1 Tax=Haloarchaeobius sp. HME9146 TaxID=2978732 RepID=UPI0021BFB4F4|nr:extracellular solute-binding protein [Haloarchaeobius sp. HME9146]MCT9096443.1 extracellular solute-binding protein [Haloarchaeobius sp. HME9146]